MKTRLTILALLLLPIAVPTGADEGRIPIFGPIVLDASVAPVGGKYIVTQNITAASGSAIEIIGNQTGHVEIDLNGFSLEVASGGDEVVKATGVQTFVIRNGVVRHGATNRTNVYIKNCNRVLVENLKISNGRYGIHLDTGVKGFALHNNAITFTGDSGILVNYDTNPAGEEIAEGSITNNTIREPGIAGTLPNQGRGIESRFGISSVIIADNRIERPLSYGITVNSTGAVVLTGNRVNEPGYRGIIASRTTACRIAKNVVRGAGVQNDDHQDRGGDGIFINDTASNCLVLNNVSSGNWMSGVRVEGDRSHIEDNVLNANSKAGLHFEETALENTYGGNTVRGNAIDNSDPVGTCQVSGCSTAASRDVCDEGTGNTSFGDNLGPGPPKC